MIWGFTEFRTNKKKMKIWLLFFSVKTFDISVQISVLINCCMLMLRHTSIVKLSSNIFFLQIYQSGYSLTWYCTVHDGCCHSFLFQKRVMCSKFDIYVFRPISWVETNVFRFSIAMLFWLSQARTRFSNAIYLCLFMFNKLRWDVIIRFVDNNCLKFLFIIKGTLNFTCYDISIWYFIMNRFPLSSSPWIQPYITIYQMSHDCK